MYEAVDIYKVLGSGNSNTSVKKIKAISSMCRDTLEVTTGSVCEFGTYRGDTSLVLLSVIDELGSKNMCYFFDTFEGLPEGDPEVDMKVKSGSGPLPKGSLCFSLQDYKEKITKMTGDLGITKPRYTTVKGDIRKTLTHKDIGQIAFAVLDVDYHDTTKYVLEYMDHLLVPGSVVYLDDYTNWAGAKKAVDEFLEVSKGFRLSSSGGHYFLRKVLT